MIYTCPSSTSSSHSTHTHAHAHGIPRCIRARAENLTICNCLVDLVVAHCAEVERRGVGPEGRRQGVVMMWGLRVEVCGSSGGSGGVDDERGGCKAGQGNDLLVVGLGMGVRRVAWSLTVVR